MQKSRCAVISLSNSIIARGGCSLTGAKSQKHIGKTYPQKQFLARIPLKWGVIPLGSPSDPRRIPFGSPSDPPLIHPAFDALGSAFCITCCTCKVSSALLRSRCRAKFAPPVLWLLFACSHRAVLLMSMSDPSSVGPQWWISGRAGKLAPCARSTHGAVLLPSTSHRL